MDKKEVAGILDDIAALLEARGENPFKTRAYTNAARSLRDLEDDLEGVVAAGGLRDVPGIGAGIAKVIQELVTEGRSEYYDELRAGFPPAFRELLAVPGLGPKKIKLLYDKLGVASVAELEAACRAGRLASLPGFTDATAKKILAGIEAARARRGQFLPSAARETAQALATALAGVAGVDRVELAGSLRRNRELIGDIDLVCAASSAPTVMKRFTELGRVEAVVEAGERRSVVRLDSGIEADLQVVPRGELPFALLRATGSKEHYGALVARAGALGLSLDEHGLKRGGRAVRCRDERAIYEALDLDYVPPELRENLGEIEAAAGRALPRLVERAEIRGVVHVHSTYSDGADTLEEMVRTAAELGYQYVGITDHSKSAFYAHGLSEAEVERQHGEIALLQSRFPGIRILKGIESDILADGALDYTEEILDSFDFVIASIHSRFRMDGDAMTERIVRAIENPYTAILGHPTGRRLLERESYALDVARVIDAARANGVAIELNAHPQRLDLDWRLARQAADRGVMAAVDPDAHSTRGLLHVDYGVGLARKAWFPAEQVLNTRDAAGFLAFSQARRPRRAA
jgi:DNA polymerase (family 10)